MAKCYPLDVYLCDGVTWWWKVSAKHEVVKSFQPGTYTRAFKTNNEKDLHEDTRVGS